MKHRLTGFLGALALTSACFAAAPSVLDDKAAFHYELANNFFYDHNTTSAIRELYTSLEHNPDHAKAHHLLGFIYFGRRDYVRAREHLEKAVALDPDFFEAIANLGTLELALERWEAALPPFERLIGEPLYQTPYLAHNNLGWALLNLVRLEEARVQLETAIFLKPEFCLGYNNLGRLHATAGNTKEALQRFHKATELCPQYSEPHYFLGRIYAALSAPEEARDHFKRCHNLGPESPFGRRCGEAL
jgi:Flp pilus assembly protein TadD